MPLAIHDSQVDRAIYVVDTSGAAELLEEAIQLAPQGRRRQLPLRTWLVGAYLAIEEAASFKTTTIHKLLTTAISLQKQHELGVRYTVDGQTEVISKSRFDYLTRWLPKRLAYTPGSSERWDLDLDEAEMSRRRELVEQVIARILAASLVIDGGSWYALDGTGTWSWGKSKYTVKDDDDVREDEQVHDDPAGPDDRVRDETVDGAEEETAADDGSVVPTGSTKRSRKVRTNYDPDAAYGSKTSKSGKREPYYGFVIDAAIRVSPPGEPTGPVVVERLLVSPASTDVVAPTLKLLDQLRDTKDGVTDIAVDRHYSYKKAERWADELCARDISQHFDLRSDEQGFKDINGMRLAAGWMHCPATPDGLAEIPRPGPGASKAEKDAFRERIAERFNWALDRHERVNADGRSRWMCPALAGKMGCPLREGTVAVAEQAGLPIVDNPPDPATAPACCTNASGIVSDRSEAMRKHQQPYYWGSDEWQAAYDLRVYVEGLFGSLKNADTEGVRRGFTKFVGLPMVSIGLALAAAVCNVRHQRRFWEDDPNRPAHPLLEADPETVVFEALSAEACEAEDARLRAAASENASDDDTPAEAA